MISFNLHRLEVTSKMVLIKTESRPRNRLVGLFRCAKEFRNSSAFCIVVSVCDQVKISFIFTLTMFKFERFLAKT